MTNKKIFSVLAIVAVAAIMGVASITPAFAGIDAYHTEHSFDKAKGAIGFVDNGVTALYGFTYGQTNDTPNQGPPTMGGTFSILAFSPFPCFESVEIDKSNFEWGYDLTYVSAELCGGTVTGIWAGNSPTETSNLKVDFGENCGDGQLKVHFQGQSQEADSALFYNGALVGLTDNASISKGQSTITECGPVS